ncbi:MAG TPA: glycoside hydrolase family 1 protein [Candidatus Saccharimonadales bacterium]|jgi:beta-glucosidase
MKTKPLAETIYAEKLISDNIKQFPENFMWGASTASHQVEGGNHNQWSVWEKQNAKRLASDAVHDLRLLPNYDALRVQLQDPNNYLSGAGVEHYSRYEADFDLLGQLNMNAFRFSIEWSRLEPTEGLWNEAEVEHYRRYITALKSRNIEPVLTLWHWTLPVWFADKGGFERSDNIHYFERYVRKVAEEFGAELRYVVTLNEPNVYTSFGYGTGTWPPARKRPLLAVRVYRNLIKSHIAAYDILKLTNPELQIGPAAQLSDSRPVQPRNPLNRIVIALQMRIWNWWFLNAVRNKLDFIGVNYYFTEYRDWMGRIKNPPGPRSDLGWYMEPSGIQDLLQSVWRRYHKPLLIIENGLADADDKQRQWWLEQTLSALNKAMLGGVPVIGYLHWSLLDNFEWAYGWWPKFGLIAVDRHTMKRTIRPSAHWLAKRIQSERSSAAALKID